MIGKILARLTLVEIYGQRAQAGGDASPRIIRAIHQSTQPMEQDSPGTHQAGFQGGIEGQLPGPRPKLGSHATQGFHFCVAGVSCHGLPDGIAALGDDAAIQHDNSPNGQVSCLSSLLSQVNSLTQKGNICLV